MSQTFSFEVNVVNLCETEGRLESFSFSHLLRAFIFGDASFVPLPNIAGEATNMQCGGVNFEILDASVYSEFLTLLEDRLVLESNNPAHEGFREIYVKAFLVDYPNVISQTSLGIQIDPC